MIKGLTTIRWNSFWNKDYKRSRKKKSKFKYIHLSFEKEDSQDNTLIR